jgi:hypothetical protein
VKRGNKMHVLQTYLNPNSEVVPFVLPGLQWGVANMHGKLRTYDFGTAQWSYSQHTAPWLHASAACLDPVTGKIIVIGVNKFDGTAAPIYFYDPDADTLVAGPKMMLPTFQQPLDLVHVPTTDQFYLFGNNGAVWNVIVDRATIANCRLVLLTTAGPKPTTGRPRGYPSFNWDSINGRIGGSFVNGNHFEFDPATLTWTATPITPETGIEAVSNDFSCSDYDPVSGCYIAIQIHPTLGPVTWAIRP